MDAKKTALVIGGGPGGLTAALELLRRTEVVPIVYEAGIQVGGISRTVNYKNNRIDIGGHRFFSKSDRVMAWWLDIMPVQAGHESAFQISYQNKTRTVDSGGEAPDPETTDCVMLVRQRVSRIYFLRKFFDYPISLNLNTIRNLGPIRMTKIGLSYLKARLLPIRNERHLEDFFINRFGRELYLTFFKDYTEKVWGAKCTDIEPDWGRQRIKGLSITKALLHALGSIFRSRRDVAQKGVETSLIERFLYPKYGPGQMWETVQTQVEDGGGRVHLRHRVTGLNVEDGAIASARITGPDGVEQTVTADYFISTMPVRELIGALDIAIPDEVRRVAEGLEYRDFITVGLLVDRLLIRDESRADKLPPDTWIYIQERDVKIGRLQIFNNWSPYMVAEPGKVWIGLEYFCNEGDELWSMEDEAFAAFAIRELAQIDIIDEDAVRDHVVLRVPKAYPGYFGTYTEFDTIREFLDRIPNLYLVGRNGQHRYNNQDHSMLTAMEAVDNIAAGRSDKANLWAVNIEQEYHEEIQREDDAGTS